MPARILIADDNSVVRSALHQLLDAPGREILEAENGQRAVSMALEQPPDIAILDLAMPLMDGLKAAREIHDHLPELPIVMYTMHWSSQLHLEAVKSGIVRVIAKADSASLVAAVEELLKDIPAQATVDLLPPPSVLPPPPTAMPAAETASAAPAEAWVNAGDSLAIPDSSDGPDSKS